MTLSHLIMEGISAALAGDRAAAREAFAASVERAPAESWLWWWLAAVSEGWDAFLDVLNRASSVTSDPAFASFCKRFAVDADSFAPAICPLCATLHLTGFSEAVGTPRCSTCRGVTSLLDLDVFFEESSVDRARISEVLEKTVAISSGTYRDEIVFALARLNLGQVSEAVLHLRKAHEEKPEIEALGMIARSLEERAFPNRFEKPAPEPLELARRTVLMVDDSPTARKIVTLTLEKQGFRVVTAADGATALLILQELVPSLVLLDVAMPGMDGFQLCRKIKENPVTSQVPVVMLSGNDKFTDRMKGRLAGAADYLPKPFNPELLVSTVEANMKLPESS